MNLATFQNYLRQVAKMAKISADEYFLCVWYFLRAQDKTTDHNLSDA